MKLFPNWALLKTTRCSPRISYAGKTKTTEDKHLPEATEAARTLTPAPCPPEQHVPKATGAARTLTPAPCPPEQHGGGVPGRQSPPRLTPPGPETGPQAGGSVCAGLSLRTAGCSLLGISGPQPHTSSPRACS